MREISYPLFFKDTDHYMSRIDTVAHLDHFEAIDIEAQEYTGWDSLGLPVELYMKGDEVCAKLLSETVELDKLLAAISRYGELRKIKQPKPQTTDAMTLFAWADNNVGKKWWRFGF